jgi:Flp pilus assembly protein TadD
LALFVGWRMSTGLDARVLFELAEEAYAADPARSESLARQAIEARGGRFADAELLLCCGLARRNAWPQVATTLAPIELAECGSDLLLELGRIAVAGKQTETALTVLQQARDRSGSQQVEALILLAGLFQTTGQFGEMIGIFEELTRVAPDDPRWWSQLARAYESLDDPRAVDVYRDAIKQQLPQDRSLAMRYKLIERLIFLGEAAGAGIELEQLETFLASAPESGSSSQQARVDVYRARLLRLEGRPAEALQVLDQTLDELGEVPELIRLRGIALLDVGDLEGAARELGRAASLVPHDEIVHFKLAEVYRRRGDPALAAQHRRQYERVHKASLEIIELQTRAASGEFTVADRERLVDLYRALGNNEAANVWSQKVSDPAR